MSYISLAENVYLCSWNSRKLDSKIWRIMLDSLRCNSHVASSSHTTSKILNRVCCRNWRFFMTSFSESESICRYPKVCRIFKATSSTINCSYQPSIAKDISQHHELSFTNVLALSWIILGRDDLTLHWLPIFRTSCVIALPLATGSPTNWYTETKYTYVTQAPCVEPRTWAHWHNLKSAKSLPETKRRTFTLEQVNSS